MAGKNVEEIIARFPQGVTLQVEVAFPEEYRIGWKRQGKVYRPGAGSYYPLEQALELAWEVFEIVFTKEEESK